MAQGRPQPGEPQRGGGRTRLPPLSLHLRSRRCHGGSLDRLTRRGPAPLSSGPRSEFGAGQGDCTLLRGWPGGSRGLPKYVSVGY